MTGHLKQNENESNGQVLYLQARHSIPRHTDGRTSKTIDQIFNVAYKPRTDTQFLVIEVINGT